MRGGCRKGDQCQYVHPKLCRKALETRVCANKRCRFYHVNGTKFTNENDLPTPLQAQQEIQLQTPTRILQRPTPYSDAVKWQAADSVQVVSGSEKQPQSSSCATNDRGTNDFLEVKQQIKVMQDQIQLLIALTKSNPQFQPADQCCSKMGRH